MSSIHDFETFTVYTVWSDFYQMHYTSISLTADMHHRKDVQEVIGVFYATHREMHDFYTELNKLADSIERLVKESDV